MKTKKFKNLTEIEKQLESIEEMTIRKQGVLGQQYLLRRSASLGKKEGLQTTRLPRMEIRELFGQSEPVLRRTQR